MKKILFICLLVWSCTTQLQANHILGSLIEYDYQSGNRYLIYTTIYRNCNDCKFNGIGGGNNSNICNDLGRLDIYGLNNITGNYQIIGNITATRLGITDITTLCPKDSSTCQVNNTYGFGTEAHLFQSNLNLTTYIDQGYTEFKIGFSKDGRSTGISFPVEQSHFNFCYINTVYQQTSPKAKRTFSQKLTTNVPVFIDASFEHSNFDSVAYVLDTAWVSENQVNNYAPGKSSSVPLEVLAGTDPYLYKPQGIFLDSFSGQLMFTPTMNGDIGAVVIECRGFKLIGNTMSLISRVRKDIEFTVTNGDNNSPYFFGLQNGTFQACAGETYFDDLFYNDEGVNGVSDTVYLSLAKLNTLDISLQHRNSARPPFRTSTFSWDVPIDAERDEPYIFTVLANDSNCPKMGLSYYNYTIKVTKAKEVTATKLQTNCNSFRYFAQNFSNSDFLRFSILDSNKNELSGSAINDDTAELIFPSKGKWYVQLLSLESGASCPFTFIDSVEIADFKQPSLDLGGDRNVCFNETLNITPFTIIENNPAVFSWEINQSPLLVNGNQLDTQFTSSQNIKVTLEDGTGCKVEDSITINVSPLWNNEYKDTGLCLNFPEPLYLPAALEDTAGLDDWTFSGQNVTGNFFSGTGLVVGEYDVNISVIDTFGCSYLDTFSLEIGQPFAIDITALPDFCQYVGLIDLENLSNPSPANGSWFALSHPRLIETSFFNTDSAIAGNYDVIYAKTLDGCTVDTTLQLTILPAPEITFTTPLANPICNNLDSVVLRINEPNGIFRINNIQDSVFVPSNYNDSATIYVSRTHSINSCTTNFEEVVVIDSTVQARLILSQPVFCFEDNDLQLNLNRTSYRSTWNTNGQGIFTALDTNTYQYTLSPTEKTGLTPIEFNVLVESNNSCPDLNIDSVIIQNPEFKIIYQELNLIDCELGSAEFKLADSNFIFYDSVHWFINGIQQIGNGFANDNHIFSKLRRGNQQVTIRPFKYQCYAEFDTILTIFPKPKPQIIASPAEFYSARLPKIDFDVRNFKPNYNYSWSSDPNFISLNGNNPYSFEMPGDTGTHEFSLITTSDKGCRDTLSYQVICLPKDWILIPNAFSPNADGPVVNEIFKAEGRVSSDFSLQVFNMWGEKLFETTNINEGWNGLYQNEPCSPGTYFYVAKFIDDIGRPIERKGNLILLR